MPPVEPVRGERALPLLTPPASNLLAPLALRRVVEGPLVLRPLREPGRLTLAGFDNTG